MNLVSRWHDILSWALGAYGGIGTNRRAVIRALSGLEHDLACASACAQDRLTLTDTQTLLTLVKEADEPAWARAHAEILRAATATATATRNTQAPPPPAPVRVVLPALALMPAGRAIVEARPLEGGVTFVWVEAGDLVKHKREREALDDRWPQEGRIEAIEGIQLLVALLGRHQQPLRLADAWAVDDVVLSSFEDVSMFERALPSDLCRFGLDIVAHVS